MPDCTTTDPVPEPTTDPEPIVMPECGTSKYSCEEGSVYSGIKNGLALNTWKCKTDDREV